MSHSDNQQNVRADHVYLSGFGFVPNEDPLHFGERRLKRSSVVIGSGLLLLLVLPFLLSAPVGRFLSLLTDMGVLVNGTGFYTSMWELEDEASELLLLLLSYTPVLLLLEGLLRPSALASRTPTPFRYRTAFCALLMTMGMTAFCIFCSGLMQDMLRQVRLLELTPGNPVPTSMAAYILYLFRVTVAAAVLDEILFRGIILQSLRRHDDAFALLFSAICTGLVRYTLTNDLSGFVMGLVFGYFFLRTNSLSTVICCHIAANLLTPFISTLQHIISGPYSSVIRWSVLLVAIAAGLVGFALFCRWNRNAFILSTNSRDSLSFRSRLTISLLTVPMVGAVLGWVLMLFYHMDWII